jgi:hypothetical protein
MVGRDTGSAVLRPVGLRCGTTVDLNQIPEHWLGTTVGPESGSAIRSCGLRPCSRIVQSRLYRDFLWSLLAPKMELSCSRPTRQVGEGFGATLPCGIHCCDDPIAPGCRESFGVGTRLAVRLSNNRDWMLLQTPRGVVEWRG